MRSKHSKKKLLWRDKPERTVGLDLGDRFSWYCLLNQHGEVTEEGRIATSEAALQLQFAHTSRLRIAMECGTHSPWASRLLEQLGHQVIVANAREVRSISASTSKNDRNDAEKLARLAHCDPNLLEPIRHRRRERQQDLNMLRVRDTLVRARTMLINTVRGLAKSAGARLPRCASEHFPAAVPACLPATLTAASTPLLEQIAAMTAHIRTLDQQIEKLAHRYPEISLLRTAPGIGPIVAAAYVLTLDRPENTPRSRSAGAFLGLRPRQDQSGDRDPERNIGKDGNTYLRKLLVQSAHYVLGPFGPDSALRRWGQKLAGSGGKRAKKRAIVAVARKLAVILHCMWRTGQCYQPFPPLPPASRTPQAG